MNKYCLHCGTENLGIYINCKECGSKDFSETNEFIYSYSHNVKSNPNRIKILELSETDENPEPEFIIYEPEIGKNGDIILPIGLAESDGKTRTISVTLNSEQLRRLINNSDFPEFIQD